MSDRINKNAEDTSSWSWKSGAVGFVDRLSWKGVNVSENLKFLADPQGKSASWVGWDLRAETSVGLCLLGCKKQHWLRKLRGDNPDTLQIFLGSALGVERTSEYSYKMEAMVDKGFHGLAGFQVGFCLLNYLRLGAIVEFNGDAHLVGVSAVLFPFSYARNQWSVFKALGFNVAFKGDPHDYRGSMTVTTGLSLDIFQLADTFAAVANYDLVSGKKIVDDRPILAPSLAPEMQKRK